MYTVTAPVLVAIATIFLDTNWHDIAKSSTETNNMDHTIGSES